MHRPEMLSPFKLPHKVVVLGFLFAAVIGVAGCGTRDDAGPPSTKAPEQSEDALIKQFGGPRLGSQIPAMTLEPIGAVNQVLAPSSVAMPSQAGQAMVVVFVSADCAACLRDTRFWLALRRQATERNAQFVGASVEQSREKVETFTRSLQAAHSALRDVPVLYSRTVGPTLRVGFVPFYMLIDKDGRMRNRGVGLTPEGTTDEERAAHFLEPLDGGRSRREEL